MDFFSGSATTSHALFLANVDQNVKRKFILVQVPEIIDPQKTGSEKSKKVAQNAVKLLNSINAPHNICEIGKERIRRAGRKIKEEAGLAVPADLDIGFRCLRLSESNMEMCTMRRKIQSRKICSTLSITSSPTARRRTCCSKSCWTWAYSFQLHRSERNGGEKGV